MTERIDDNKKYWAEIVEPDFKEFQASPGDLRKAFHSASSLFHMSDWLYRGNKAYMDANFTFKDKNGNSQPVTDEKTFANAIGDLHPDFELVRGIANAGKHFEVRQARHPSAPVSASNTYIKTETSGGTFGAMTFGASPLGGTIDTKRVMQEGPGKQDVSLPDLTRSVYDFWVNFRKKHGLSLK